MPSDNWSLHDSMARAAEQGIAASADHVFSRGDEVELGVDLAFKLGPAADVVHDENRIWVYGDGSWLRCDDDEVGQIAMSYAGRRRFSEKGPIGIKLSAGNVRGIVRCCKMHVGAPGFFGQAPVGAPFQTCFARVHDGVVLAEPLTREHRVKAEHVPEFDLPQESRRPDRVDQLLAETWAGCPDIDHRILYFWEWLGAAIVGIATKYKDTPLLVGPKDTGKSQILAVISSVFPVSSHRSVTLHAMANEYHRAHLSGGRINFVNELPARELLDGEAAKAILSGDTVSCRHPTERPFDWTPRCAHVFAANELPPSRDRALMDRLVVLDCPNVVPRHLQDRTLGEKIRAEAPLVASAALGALQGLLERGYLIRPPSADGLSSEWRLQGDPVAAWAQESIRPSADGDTVPSGDLYKSFAEWAKENGHQAVSSTRFGVRLGSLGFTKTRSNGSRWNAEMMSPAKKKAIESWWNQGERF